jgi:probable F420-dependent oxidoreductase
MQIGISAPLRSPRATPEVLARFARGAEERGINSVWLGEHVVTFDRYDSTYPGRRDGKFVFPEKTGLLDMTATLGFLAAQTSTLRLGTGVRILPQANPVYTAKEYATLDFLSRGRIEFGVGLGWSRQEFEACGVPFAQRGARCDEYLEVIRTLWTQERSSYEGRFYQLPECFMHPKPVQSPMIPITVGGHSTAALKRAARYGAGWYGISLTVEDTAAIIERLDGYLEAEGRKPGDLRIIIGGIGHPIPPEQIPAFAEIGVDEVLVPYLRQSSKWLEQYLDGLARFVDAARTC